MSKNDDQNNKPIPQPYTQEELTNVFITYCDQVVQYCATTFPDDSRETMCAMVALSILSFFEGHKYPDNKNDIPAFDIVACPSWEDTQNAMKADKKYVISGMRLADDLCDRFLENDKPKGTSSKPPSGTSLVLCRECGTMYNRMPPGIDLENPSKTPLPCGHAVHSVFFDGSDIRDALKAQKMLRWLIQNCISSEIRDAISDAGGHLKTLEDFSIPTRHLTEEELDALY
jgi:hypothetical protein